MNDYQKTAMEIFKLYGPGLSGAELENICIDAWVASMRTVYKRYCFCRHNDGDCDSIMFIIEEYKNLCG